MSEIKQNIQKSIALFRKKANLTQKQLAERLGVAVTNLASWEQGKSMPDIDTLFRLCSFLNVDILTISGFEPPERHYKIGDGIDTAMSDFFSGLNAMNNHSVLVGKELSTFLSPDEHQLVEDYRILNKKKKKKIRDYVLDLKANAKYKKYPESFLDEEA